jgi:outer membrane protein OmpA-like peptidoglycan-associated protein
MKRRTIAAGVACLFAAALISFLWAALWPENRCSEPRCARDRFSLFIELDAFRGVEPISMDVDSEAGNWSLRNLLADGGIDATVVADQVDLPYESSTGRLDRADLYQYAAAWRSLRAPAGADAGMYAMLTPGLVADNGEALFGLMFDYSGREGFAVAPGETTRLFQSRNPELVPALQLRTFAHELLHALNRSHIDAAPSRDGGLTVEAPTRCMTTTKGTHWLVEERPHFALSPSTILFFQTAPRIDVLPGVGHTPYDLRRSSANECEEVRSKPAIEPNLNRWQFAFRRLRRALGLGDAFAEAAPESTPTPVAVELQIQALTSPYPLGYPVALRVLARNLSDEALPLRGRLLPGFGLIQIEVRASESDTWRTVEPLAWYEPANDDEAMLASGDLTEQTVPIYYDDEGWTFPSAGVYEVRARLRLGDDSESVLSNTTEVSSAEPSSERDAAALRGLTTDGTQLDPKIGKLLMFGGRVGAIEDLEPVTRIVEEFPDTALGSALRLAQASQELRPIVNPATGKREAPDVPFAKEMLEDTCTDSGVAALRESLLSRHLGEPAPEDVADEQRKAWDGMTRSADADVRTYSDSGLTRTGPSLLFCFDDQNLTGASLRTARTLGRQLAAVKPERVRVVGHTDSTATCAYNDRLGLGRAEAVKRILVRSGVRADRITTLTLGERRPNDFSSTPEAQASNRRVEILIDEDTESRRQKRFSTALLSQPLAPCPRTQAAGARDHRTSND